MQKNSISNESRELEDVHQPYIQSSVRIGEHSCSVVSWSDSFQVVFQNILGVQTLCHCLVFLETILKTVMKGHTKLQNVYFKVLIRITK